MLRMEFEQSAATVVSLAEHFRELKLRVAGLKEVFEAIDRGFFSPSEDEQVRHLLVSYSQSRNALIELVLSVYDREKYAKHPRPEAMAVAYAGALVLIDAAMFLRENFHEHPVVRAKLNEPEPNFGIRKGTYDKVQRSLTSPRHVWHLYHAVRYMKENWAQLMATAANDDCLRSVLDVIQRYQFRLKVGRREYLWSRTRVRGRQLRTRLERDVIGRALYGLQKCVSRLLSDRYTRENHTPALPSDVETVLHQQLRSGDILVTRKEHALTNYFLPGYWPHVALYLGTLPDLERMKLDQHKQIGSIWNSVVSCDPKCSGRVLESLKDGVRLRSVSTPFQCDAVAVVRPQLEPAVIQSALERGVCHAGKPYDFDFDFTRSDRMVCTEVVYRTYDGVGGLSFDLVKRAGRLTISAEDILQRALDQNGFDVHAVYTPETSNGQIQYGAAAGETVRMTMEGKG